MQRRANTDPASRASRVSHVALDMDGRIPMILDGGPVGIGIESTIVDLSEGTPMILRPGYITQEMLQEVLGEKVCMDPGIIASDSTRKPKAPGMKHRHDGARRGDLCWWRARRTRSLPESMSWSEKSSSSDRRSE